MTTGMTPYVTPAPTDSDPAANVVETTITASIQTVDIGGGVMMEAETYDGAIPGPTLRFNVGDTAIIRLVNLLPHRTGIHWHGIELANATDGTPVTQNGLAAAFAAPPPAPAPAGGTYLYKFQLPRPGVYWYHPHHFHSTNRVFRGLYGMIIVTDPNEAALIAAGTLPNATDTLQLVLGDTTVCETAGSNDAATYVDPTTLPVADRPEWLSGQTSQPGPTPLSLCEIAPAGSAMAEDGSPAPASFLAGQAPNIQRAGPGRTNEGQTVLTNGMNVGGRAGPPDAPGALDGAAIGYAVQPGQGLRLQIVNCAVTRYFRLRLTNNDGTQILLMRVGGEGGLLDAVVEEGGTPGGFDTKYDLGEVLLPPASRVDVVASIPDTATGTLTLWTRDYARTGQGFSRVPSVPVAHFEVSGAVVAPAFSLPAGTQLRAGIPGQAIEVLPAPTDSFLDPAGFTPAKPGVVAPTQTIVFGAGGGVTIDGVAGSFSGFMPYTNAPHVGSSRYAAPGGVLEMSIQNTSLAHHPFHLHGFSFQPISLTTPGGPDYVWPYAEFRDNVDMPSNYTLNFRVRLEDRPLTDGITMGGAFGRWLFHCHIFFHAHQGMISELVVTSADGSERPYVNVGGSWTYTPAGGTATRKGTFAHPDGNNVTLTASDGAFNPPLAPAAAGTWDWEFDSAGEPDGVRYVYITATDSDGRQDQAVFRLKVGAPDDGADIGDPHIHTVDGKRYDFQAVGEFTLLRDRQGMEIQARQWPVATANPITDSYSGLKSCVSVNTAVALRVGAHQISYQPGREQGVLRFFVDGKQAHLPQDGLDLGVHRLTSEVLANGTSALRVAYAHGPVVTASPRFWNSQKVWIMDVDVAHTQAVEGIMGEIHDGNWLPLLPSGASLGPRPEALQDRYVTLYRTFADAWRVSDATSLFTYDSGASSATFTDRDWPAEKPPCKLKQQFIVPGANPILEGIDPEDAKKICQDVTLKGLHENCVFDVATTGDKTMVEGYLHAQQLMLAGTAVLISTDKAEGPQGEQVKATATVTRLHGTTRPEKGKYAPKLTGTVTFFVDGARAARPAKIDAKGRAAITIDDLAPGLHRIRAEYSGNEELEPAGSSNAHYTVKRRKGIYALPDDRLLGTKLTVPGRRKAGDTEVTLDVKTARRMLLWVNAAKRPEDLLSPPDVLTHLHVEYRKRKFPETHPPVEGEHGGHAENMHHPDKTGFDEASKVLKARNAFPLAGFQRIEDLLSHGFLAERLRSWFWMFSMAAKGDWAGPYSNPGAGFDRPVHAAVLHTGKVLFFGLPTGKDAWLWTPDAGAGTIAPTANKPTDSLFCSGHAFLSDGRLLVVGGGGDGTGPRHNHGWIFDPVSETWTRTAGNGSPGDGDMAYYRWYPTLVTMGDEPGRVLVVSGDDTGGTDVAQMEMYMETTDRFELVWGPAGVGDTSADRSFPQIYPGLNLLPGGEIFYTPTGWHSGGCSGAANFPSALPSAYFDLISAAPPVRGSWTDVGTQDAAAEQALDRVKGMSVLLLQPSYPFVQVMVVGGGQDPESATTFQMINLSTLTPEWGPPVTLPDGLARVNVNVVALPDGTVFVSGGRPSAGTPVGGGACWIYDPVAMTWQECDVLANRRAYHSVAVLLPDGRVATAGNECPADTTYEIFSPPYLFAPDGTLAARPEITSLPSQVHHGLDFDIETPDPAAIDKIVLVRPMAVTHQTDSEQRVVHLDFAITGPTTITATAPNGWHPHSLAQRSWYMVFLVDLGGTPSVGKFMHLH
ncbi:multicopper oxidase domain-containing protein [Sedimentitalea todarodis]|uniref:Multicopper oxidase domain-containing protein n=1 Tax=Sedimentitalea todarodis TaxID=1631240 RepID=A0ABU3VGZ8_9RHOB|nr:multicopper oxidase domain-containing protein [Sedimentitalea todarodis]MDU9005435.1 multicopper oxidase domain-containing protein [Sedimentitalea todarodis]